MCRSLLVISRKLRNFSRQEIQVFMGPNVPVTLASGYYPYSYLTMLHSYSARLPSSIQITYLFLSRLPCRLSRLVYHSAVLFVLVRSRLSVA